MIGGISTYKAGEFKNIAYRILFVEMVELLEIEIKVVEKLNKFRNKRLHKHYVYIFCLYDMHMQ